MLKELKKELLFLLFALIVFIGGIYYDVFYLQKELNEVQIETYEFNREYLGIE